MLRTSLRIPSGAIKPPTFVIPTAQREKIDWLVSSKNGDFPKTERPSKRPPDSVMQVLVRKMKINTLWILLLGFTCFALCGSSLAQEPQGIFLPENSRLVWAVVGEGV